jgi:hypothetical protein
MSRTLLKGKKEGPCSPACFISSLSIASLLTFCTWYVLFQGFDFSQFQFIRISEHLVADFLDGGLKEGAAFDSVRSHINTYFQSTLKVFWSLFLRTHVIDYSLRVLHGGEERCFRQSYAALEAFFAQRCGFEDRHSRHRSFPVLPARSPTRCEKAGQALPLLS